MCMTMENRVRVFRALSVETRIEMVHLLAQRTLCVGALAHRLGITAGAVSQHLRILQRAGLVERARCGHYVHYRLATDAANRCRTLIESLFTTEPTAPKEGDS